MSNGFRQDTLICPFCAAGAVLSPAAQRMSEHRQARAATGGVNRLLSHVASWRVTAPSPGGDMPVGLYRRWVCGSCRLGVIEGIVDE